MQSNNDEKRLNPSLATPPKLCSDVIDVIETLKQYNRSQIDKILYKHAAVESTSELETHDDVSRRAVHLEKVNIFLFCFAPSC